MVATGDDPEKESPDTKMNERKASPKQLEILAKTYTGENLTKLLESQKISKLEDISMTKASELISKLAKKKTTVPYEPFANDSDN